MVVFVMAFAMSVFPSRFAVSADFEDTAKRFVETLSSDAINSLTAKGLPKEDRIERFREMFNRNFSVKGIGKWVLGRHWRKASKAERNEYLVLFESLMVLSYVDRFAKYAGETLHVTKTLKQDDNNAMVFSEIRRPQGMPPIRVDWRVARKGETYKIVDVLVEGTSMSNTLRSDFGSIIRQRGGKVSGLLETLREKTKHLESGSQK